VFSVTMDEEETVRLRAETGFSEDFPTHPGVSG
jgi:hypothetical protein